MAVTTDDFAGKPKAEPEETPSLVQPRPEPKDGEEGYEDASNGKLRNSLPVPNPQPSLAKKK